MSASLALGPPARSPFSLFLKSQFGSSPLWPSKNVNLKGRWALVTGSTSGLGLEASRQLLSHGLSGLIMAVRSEIKGEKVAATFRYEYPDADIRVWPLQMESYASVQALVRRADNDIIRLDMAILNAGVQAADFTVIEETGHEKLIQVNYLSTMLLAVLLLPILKSKSPLGEPGRLTIVSSGTARGATISEEENISILAGLDDKARPWKPVERYAVSKLLGHLFLIDLASHVEADDVVVNLADPGLVKNTALQDFAPPLIVAFFYIFKAIFGRSIPVGASTYVDAIVVKGKDSHGCFVSNWSIAPFAAFVYTPMGVAVRERLWKETMNEFAFTVGPHILRS